MVNNDNDKLLPTFSAEEIDDTKQLRMLEQLKIAQQLKEEAIARLLKKTKESDDSLIRKETDKLHSKEYDSSDPADDGDDPIGEKARTSPADKDLMKNGLSFQDILDYTEQRQDDEVRVIRFVDTQEDNCDYEDDDDLTIISSLTNDSYEKAWLRAQELWEHAGMIGEARSTIQHSNYQRKQKQQEMPIETTSIGSMEMLFNHLTCNARDTITWSDWKAWEY